MSDFKIIKTQPNEADFELFRNLPNTLYPANSQRFSLGNDPVSKYLEGCYVLLENGEPKGRFAFYENPELHYQGERAACIGSFEGVNDQSIANALIEEAKTIARAKNYAWLIGPMESSTWNNYRFSDQAELPSFTLEPTHLNYYPDHFAKAGFSPIANYVSNLDENMVFDPKVIADLENQYLEKGATIRSISLENLEEDLHRVAIFSNEAFKNNFLFTPCEPNDFVRKYLQYKPLFDPELVWIMEDQAGEIQGVFLSFPDFADINRETLIIKTIARKSDSPFQHIGVYFREKIKQVAANKGFKKIIHAFMIKDNASARISESQTGRAFKTYTLFGMRL